MHHDAQPGNRRPQIGQFRGNIEHAHFTASLETHVVAGL